MASESLGSTTIDAKPRAGCWFFVLPVLVAVFTIVAYLFVFSVGAIGRSATGDRVQMTFAACPEALPVVQDRVDTMGLGAPEYTPTDTGFVLVATLPEDRSVAEAIPHTLARRAELEVFGSEDPTTVLFSSADIVDGFITLEEMGTALTIVQLDDAATKKLRDHQASHTEHHLDLFLDGKPIAKLRNSPPIGSGQLKLYPADNDPRALALAAEWSVVLGSGPLPCPASVTNVETLTPAS